MKKSIDTYRSTAVSVLFVCLLLPTLALAAGTEAVAVDLSRIGISNEGQPDNATGLTATQAVKKIELEQQAIRQMVRQNFCSDDSGTELCAKLPNDNTDFSELFVYIFLTQSAQNSFDIFSWQSFIGLNWGLDHNGDHAKSLDDSHEIERVWSSYNTPRQIFDPDHVDKICGDIANSTATPTLTTEIFLQTSGRPLIDRNLNYVVYDIRVNPVMEKYILDNGLNTLGGQQTFLASGSEIAFPQGYYDNVNAQSGGEPGSMAIKSAWKVIDTAAGDNAQDYFTLQGLISVAAKHSETGKAFCAEETLGLVGMHIMRRTKSGHGDKWIWSTFEHNNNAPLAVNYRRPNDVLADSLFENGCQAPEHSQTDYAFYNKSCPQCKSNVLPDRDWKWAAGKPYAASFAQPQGVGTQVVRCWEIFEGTQLINNEWQNKLAGTVWANYQSTSAQWRGANRGVMVPEGEVPRFMTNTTMETYEQYSQLGSCMSCHAAAKSAAGQDSKFSFLLGLVGRY